MVDDSHLTVTICEEASADDEEAPPVPVHPACCAGGAEYSLIFEVIFPVPRQLPHNIHPCPGSLESGDTPSRFPSAEVDAWLLRYSGSFSPLHLQVWLWLLIPSLIATLFSLWQAGGYAGAGLTLLAREGEGGGMEEELADKRNNIKTVIKANGLRYPNLNGKTVTSFKTDTQSHFVSFVSKLSPSPDWMVGVSMLEMCLPNCTWVAMTDLLLYPWDIGVSSGISYQTETTPSIPPQAIHRISSQHPLDMNNPFYHPQGRPVKPLARVTITKIREYTTPPIDTNKPFDQS